MGSQEENGSLKMEYNYLGQSGMMVSNLCLGTSTFGPQQHEKCSRPACDDATACGILDRFAECGGSYIDCADMYSHGDAEAIVGKWLNGKPRDKFVISTKVMTQIDKTNPNDFGLSRKHVIHNLEKSLKNLQTDHVDMYLMHYWDNAVPIESTMRTLNDMVRCGKIRNLGVSNFQAYQLQKTIDCCKYMGLEPVINYQGEYNLLSRGMDIETMEVLQNEGLTFTPWGALKGGWLSGKIKRGHTAPPPGSRISWATSGGLPGGVTATGWSKFGDNEGVFDLLDYMETVAQKHKKSVANVATRWLLQKDLIPSVIIGVKNLTQLEDNLQSASGWQLSQEEMKQLDEITDIQMPDHYVTTRRQYKGRLVANLATKM